MITRAFLFGFNFVYLCMEKPKVIIKTAECGHQSVYGKDTAIIELKRFCDEVVSENMRLHQRITRLEKTINERLDKLKNKEQ